MKKLSLTVILKKKKEGRLTINRKAKAKPYK